jgi:hypothetical protein
MSLANRRVCIFCGGAPNQKTREHVLPYWLLEMTGDPLRVVTFGQDFAKDKNPIRYSWSNFVAPACAECNNKYAFLEEQAKAYIEALQRRETLPAHAYIVLLDWLDKVRIGVWLTRHMIENHPIEITPHFQISARIAQKDRMLALYVFDSDNKGINLLGSDSLIFNSMPSCFGCRINDILLFNVSSDFFCSQGCGMPHPRSISLLVGGDNDGMQKLEGFEYAAEISNPVTDLEIFKPVVWLYQPIKLPSDDPAFKGGFYGHTNVFDSRLYERTLQGQSRLGALFRQYVDRVDVIASPDTLVEFDTVTGSEGAMQKDIAASVYDTQIHLFDSLQYEWVDPKAPREHHDAYRQLQLEHTTELANMYRFWPSTRP